MQKSALWCIIVGIQLLMTPNVQGGAEGNRTHPYAVATNKFFWLCTAATVGAGTGFWYWYSRGRNPGTASDTPCSAPVRPSPTPQKATSPKSEPPPSPTSAPSISQPMSSPTSLPLPYAGLEAKELTALITIMTQPRELQRQKGPLEGPPFEQGDNPLLESSWVQLMKATTACCEKWKEKLINPSDLTSEKRYSVHSQTYIFPENSQLNIFGDCHGDRDIVRAFERFQEQKLLAHDLTIQHKGQRADYFIFCGDFTDRGVYGVEILALLMHFKIKNPEYVFLMRGNHEDCNVQLEYTVMHSEGFMFQLKKYFTKDDITNNLTHLLEDFYQSLPVVLYGKLQGHWIHFMHGGIETAYDPQRLLQSQDDKQKSAELWVRATLCKTNRSDILSEFITNNTILGPSTEVPQINQNLAILRKNCAEKADCYCCYDIGSNSRPITCSETGTTWNDFAKATLIPVQISSRKCSITYNKQFTEWFYQRLPRKFQPVLIVRAHQHLGENDGIGKSLLQEGVSIEQWKPVVITTVAASLSKSLTPFISYLTLISTQQGIKITQNIYQPKKKWKLNSLSIPSLAELPPYVHEK